jgi:uracil-DNA glycosylase family 4
MSLQLDARQRAMLEEIGVRIFAPEPHLLPADDGTPPSPPRQAAGIADLRPAEGPATSAAAAAAEPAAPVRPPAAPVRQPELGALAEMDWNALEQAVTQWASARRRQPVFGTGDLRADWLCVGEPPLEEEERQGTPFVGDAGKLLDNMLAAVGASRRQGAYLTNALKCRPSDDRQQDAEELAQSLAFLQRQLQLVEPKVILAMGRFAVQALLQTNEPIGKLRGRLHRFGDVPVVVTYHPVYLLRNLADKGRAWADLCLAQSVVRAGN